MSEFFDPELEKYSRSGVRIDLQYLPCQELKHAFSTDEREVAVTSATLQAVFSEQINAGKSQLAGAVVMVSFAAADKKGEAFEKAFWLGYEAKNGGYLAALKHPEHEKPFELSIGQADVLDELAQKSAAIMQARHEVPARQFVTDRAQAPAQTARNRSTTPAGQRR